ncbi:hypothetical protein [Agreia sp. COWG]|uniref:hypothetical protein n=1 Tax=Agreia sp. COWG TaxID=2773266 RepID=UPI00192843EA|nr:hypothetical protein [Agreia sp. COWG]
MEEAIRKPDPFDGQRTLPKPQDKREACRLKGRSTIPRDLNHEERTLLALLLSGDWLGAAEARHQLETAKHARHWFEGSLSFDLAIDPHLPLVPVSDGILEPTDRLVYHREALVGGVMIWVCGGRISSFEYYWSTDDMPTALPASHQIETR